MKELHIPMGAGRSPARKRSASHRARPSSNVSHLPRVPQNAQKSAQPLFTIAGRFDTTFFILVLTLLGMGLVVLFSASHASSYHYMGNSYYYIIRQGIFAMAGVGIMLFVSTINYEILRRFCWLLYLASIVLMGLCYFFEDQNGAHRWIKLGIFGFQPSEIAKFAVILLFAHLMDRDQDKMQLFQEGILRYIILYLFVAAILLPQPHLSATLLIGIIVLVMMVVGGSRWQQMLLIGVVGIAAVGLFILIFEDVLSSHFAHVETRLTYWLDPFSNTDPGSYQTRQSLLAIGSGGLWGVGFGDSRQKHMYLPEVRNDFVFAIVCEELGFIGAAIVIGLFTALIWRGFTIAMRARDIFGSLLVVGITTQIGIQAFLNIAVVTNLVPNTGISLPFFSYGGTALMILLAEIGVVLAVSRQARYEKE